MATTGTRDPYTAEYGVPDEPAFVGQVIDSGGELQYLPDGALAINKFGHTYRPITTRKGTRAVMVERRDGTHTEFTMEQFTTRNDSLGFMALRVVYVPEV